MNRSDARRGSDRFRCSNVSSNGLTQFTFSSVKDAAAALETLDVGHNSLKALPDTTKAPNLKVLIATNNNVTDISSAESSKLQKLQLDGNPLPQDLPEWVYTQTETSGLDFSAVPLCMRGWVLPASSAVCRKCDAGSYALTGAEQRCRRDGCGDGFTCNGGFSVVPKESNWRAPPYFRADVGVGYATGTPELHSTCDRARCTVTSNSVDAVVRVFACPNSEACKVSDDADGKQYPLCAEGYHGPLCSLCDRGYVWSEGHRCSACNGDASSWQHLGISGVMVIGVVAYLVLIVGPLFRQISPSSSMRHASQQFSRSGYSRSAGVLFRLARVLDAAVRISVAVTHSAFSMFKAYDDKLGDQQAIFAIVFRILIGFAQVIGNLSGIAVSWPPEFYTMARWFDFAKFSFDVPSLACAIEQSSIGYTFYTRHLLYTVAPLVLIALLVLPSLWARLRRLDAVTIADLDDRRVRWTLFSVFILYPKV
jgi:hypothetical protein